MNNPITKVKQDIKHAVKVKCIELDKTFNSIQEASNVTNTDRSSISLCCNKKIKTANKYHWKYV